MDLVTVVDVEVPVEAVVEAPTVEALEISKARSKPLHERFIAWYCMLVDTATQWSPRTMCKLVGRLCGLSARLTSTPRGVCGLEIRNLWA